MVGFVVAMRCLLVTSLLSLQFAGLHVGTRFSRFFWILSFWVSVLLLVLSLLMGFVNYNLAFSVCCGFVIMRILWFLDFVCAFV